MGDSGDRACSDLKMKKNPYAKKITVLWKKSIKREKNFLLKSTLVDSTLNYFYLNYHEYNLFGFKDEKKSVRLKNHCFVEKINKEKKKLSF